MAHIPIAERRNSLVAALTALILLAAAGALCAQSSPDKPDTADPPLEKWLSASEQQQIPWKVSVSSRGLSFQQRLEARLEVQIAGKEVARRGPGGDLVLLARITDADGLFLERHASLQLGADQTMPKKQYVHFLFDALVLPGDYSVGVVVSDRRTGEHSIARRALHVAPLRNDPLPQAARNLPRLELFDPIEGLDDYYRPDVTSRLWLPVEATRPIAVELLVSLLPSGIQEGSRRLYQYNLASMLPTLKILSQLEIPRGSLRITALDLMHRKVLFEQDNVHELDWPRLRNALTQNDPGMIAVNVLQERKHNAEFLREVLGARLAALGARSAPPDAAGAAGADDPERVFIFLSSPTLFVRGTDIKPLAPPAECRCRVYYLRYQLLASGVWDDTEKIMKPLRPRLLRVGTPESLRHALADLLAEISSR